MKKFPELPGWNFEIEEVSAGVYEVKARDVAGRSISLKGVDPEMLLDKCRHQIASEEESPA